MRSLFRLLCLLMLVAFTLSFTIGNMQPLVVALPPFASITLPTNMVLYGVFVVGIFLGLLTSSVYYHRHISRTRRALKQATLEKNALQQQITTEKTEQFAIVQLRHATLYHPH